MSQTHWRVSQRSSLSHDSLYVLRSVACILLTPSQTPSEEILDENGNKIPAQSQEEVPFNLNNLRNHLAQVTLARRILPEDLASRQKLLEESVYDVAVERLRHEAKLFDELGLGNRELHHADLQKWMWDWHQKLKTRLEAEIKHIITAEAKLSKRIRTCQTFILTAS